MTAHKKIGVASAALLASFLYSAATIAQTKEETEAWILKQAAKNRFELQHAIEDGLFISRITMPGFPSDTLIEKAIPISKVTRVYYTHTQEYLSYSLRCDEPCAYLMDEPEIKRDNFLFEIYQPLNSSFPHRMNKALLHLIKIHGGHARVEKQELAKQPF